jgi:ribosomal protein L37AE/L43A
MLMTNASTLHLQHHHKRLCPCCGGTTLKILATTIVSCEVVFDARVNELVVVSESVGDTEWDANSQVECPSCDWQGQVSECLEVADK